jgi:hypothetical protein
MGNRNPHWAGHSQQGYRADLGHACRSKWEANYARFLLFTERRYLYEPCEFWFPVERGNRTYRPDFYILGEDRWVEVKGYLDRASKTKLKRFRKYCPNECLEIITGAFFREIQRQGVARLIPGWEV